MQLFFIKLSLIFGQIFCLISSFLSNGWLQVFVNGKSSQQYPINAGVPQCSITGPTLFLLYINDLMMLSVILLSVLDDTTLYSKCDQASDLWQQPELASEFESDLQDTLNWDRNSLVDISMLKKLNWFHLTSLITLVALMWKWMGLSLRKIHILRFWVDFLF